jgi:hypothetical protein
MNRLVLVSLVTFGVLVSGAAVPALAQYSPSPYGQYFSPYSRSPGINPGGGPRLSPYLNLVRGANTPALNYYLGTVPEIDRRRFQSQTQSAFDQFGQRLGSLSANPEDEDLNPNVSVTGHATAFMNTSGFFSVAGPAPVPRRNVPMSPLPPAKPTTPSKPK